MNNLAIEYNQDQDEDVDVGSFNHALVQANLTRLLGNLGKYTVCTELSLNVSNVELNQFDIDNKMEVKPDFTQNAV